MTDPWAFFGTWLLHTTVGGGLLLLTAGAFMRRCRQPARRQRLGEWGLVAALLVAGLSFLPPWLIVPLFTRPADAPAASTSMSSLSPLSPSLSRREGGETSPALGSEGVTNWRAVASEPDDEPLLLAMGQPHEAARPPVVPLHGRDFALFHSDVPPMFTRSSLPPVEADSQPEPAAVPAVAAAETWSLPHRLVTWSVAAYAVVALCFLGRWLLGYFALGRLLKAAGPAPRPVVRLFESMTAKEDRPRLLVSRRLRAPISCGIWQPTIVIPAHLCDPDEAETLRWVIAHELTHLERHDAWSCLLFGLGQAVFFVLPWFWWLRRQVRLCQEYVADAAAAEHSACVADYAQFLVSLTKAPAGPIQATGVVGNSSDLFRRVTMLLQDPIRVEKRCGRWWSLGAAGSLLALGVLAAGIGVRAEAAPPDEKKVIIEVVTDEQDEDKAESRKEKIKKVEEVKKWLDKSGFEFKFNLEGLEGLEGLLENLPDEETREKLREELKKAMEKVRKLTAELSKERGKDAEEMAKKAAKIKEEVQKFAHEMAKEKTKDAQKWAKDAVKLREEFQKKFADQAWQKPQVIVRSEEHGQGRLGVNIEKPSAALADQLDLPKGQGLVVETVASGSAAAKAGIKPNDVLLELNGKTIASDPSGLIRMLETIKSGKATEILLLRKGKKETVKLESLGEAKGQKRILVEEAKDAKPQKRIIVEEAKDAKSRTFVMPKLQGMPGMGGHAGAQALILDGRGVITTMFRTDDRFTTRHQEGSLIITVTGTAGEGKAKVNEIQVQDGGSTKKYSNVSGVPEQYRDKVKNLVEMSEKSSIKIEIRKERKGEPEEEKTRKRKIVTDDDV